MTAPGDALPAEIADLAKGLAGKDATLNTRLYADLGMTGDDAHEFVTAFAAKYDVDMGAFIWLRYFDDEGVDLMAPAIALAACALSPSFAVRWQAARNAEREVTIGHLAEVARARAWRDPGEAFKRDRHGSLLLVVFSAMSAVVMAFLLLLGAVVVYAFLAGELGERNALVLVGIVATSVLPIYFAFASWQNIRRKLASA